MATWSKEPFIMYLSLLGSDVNVMQLYRITCGSNIDHTELESGICSGTGSAPNLLG